ncbi:L,D-transpeptidase family protein [Phenylobacterium sp.]|uniref:L,D-transpeptidase family protein n=1 Tax=Phenylobacterium sp. TaxID=1871053 RepID=UPI002F9585F3
MAQAARSKAAEVRDQPVALRLEAVVARLPAADADLAAVYRARAFRPLWMTGEGPRPEAQTVLALVRSAPEDGLIPARYAPEALAGRLAAAESGDPSALAEAEVAVSRAYARYAADLRTPIEMARLAWSDPALRLDPPTPGQTLAAAAAAPSLAAHVAGLRRANPIYAHFRAALAEIRRNGGDADREQRLLANLERARALPVDLGRRFIIVDAPAGRLWAFEEGGLVDTMAVVIGKPTAPTPEMAGLIRFAVYNPYWNIPVDLARYTYAPEALRGGPAAIDALGIDVLSDWTPDPQVVAPETVDWQAVRNGSIKARLRMRPGPFNLMGGVKLMLPNRLGIYLHDTPDRAAFARDLRLVSNGCVRLEDAHRLAAWLLQGRRAGEGVEARVDLPEPVPVYITYFTLSPAPGGAVVERPDPYGRDGKLLAAIGQTKTARSAPGRSAVS